MMKILIGSGGTGGHIYPALALARHAMAVEQNNEILFVGRAQGLETRIIPSAGFELITIPARGFQRSLRNTSLFFKDLISGIGQASGVINQFKPNVVLGTGSYIAAPLVIAALLKRIPTVIHEQNALPGLANRWLAPFVNKVCVSFAETGGMLTRRSRIELTGNPRASEVIKYIGKDAGQTFSSKAGLRKILVYGGSLGALKMNEVLSIYLEENLQPDNVEIVIVTGEKYFQDFRNRLDSLPENIKLFPYLDDIPEALAVTDLAVTRSGATTIAELTALGVPAILIPSPNVANNEQLHNARVLSKGGAALLIEDTEFDHHRLQYEINRLIGNPDLLSAMRNKSKTLGIPDAAEKVYRTLQEVAR